MALGAIAGMVVRDSCEAVTASGLELRHWKASGEVEVSALEPRGRLTHTRPRTILLWQPSSSSKSTAEPFEAFHPFTGRGLFRMSEHPRTDNWLTAMDAFHLIGIARSAGYDLITSQRLIARRIGSHWLVDRASAERLASERAAHPTE
jgi:hypothetical protein